MHNLNLLLAFGLLSALGRATPVLRGTNDTLSHRLWSEAPVREPTFISQPISELPVPTFIAPHNSEPPVPTFIAPLYSQPPEPSSALGPEPTEVSNSLLARQAHAPSEPISSDIGPSQPATPEPTIIAPQHGQPLEPSWVLAPEPTEVSNSLLARQAQSVSIVPSEAILSDVGQSVQATSVIPSTSPFIQATSVVPSTGPSEPATSIVPSAAILTNVASEPISSTIGPSVQATSIIPSEPISSIIGPSVSVAPSSEPAGSAPIPSVPTTQVVQPSATTIEPTTPTSDPPKQPSQTIAPAPQSTT